MAIGIIVRGAAQSPKKLICNEIISLARALLKDERRSVATPDFFREPVMAAQISNRSTATRLDRAVAASVTAMVALNLAVFLQFQLPTPAFAAAAPLLDPIQTVELA